MNGLAQENFNSLVLTLLPTKLSNQTNLGLSE
jgi:hypothetical protein